MITEQLCSSCGKPIQWGSPVVAVRYGIIERRVRHTAVTKQHVDYFHIGCDKAFMDVKIKK